MINCRDESGGRANREITAGKPGIVQGIMLFSVLVTTVFINTGPGTSGACPGTGTGADAKTIAEAGSRGLLWLISGIILIFVIFYVQMRSFLGTGNWFTELILRILGVRF